MRLLFRASINSLDRGSLLAALALIMSCVSCSSAPGIPQRPVSTPQDVPRPQEVATDIQTAAFTRHSEASEHIIARTNTLRRQHGLQGVAPNAALTAAARDLAGFMASHDQYGHEADGSRPSERAQRHGYQACILSENIAYRSGHDAPAPDGIAQIAVTGWSTSPGHRRNMLDPDVTQIGVAVTQSTRSQRIYAVQVFGRPRSESRVFQVRNSSNNSVAYALGERSYQLRPGFTRTHRTCRAEQLHLRSPQGQTTPTIYPDHGDRFEILASDHGARLIKSR